MADLEEELLTGTVFRFAKITPTFPPDSTKPLPIHFTFNSKDGAQAAITGRWYISVWDLERASVTFARAFLPSDAEYNAFGLQVAHVRGVELPSDGVKLKLLRVLRDHIPNTDAHCGIDGLKQKKDVAKALRSALADKAFLIA